MPPTKQLTAIGLMSGTSLDGVDAALITTNGITVAETGPHITLAYDTAMRDELRAVLNREDDSHIDVMQAAEQVTLSHVEAVQELLAISGLAASQIDVIGFHGQTIAHAPERGLTLQIGDGELLATLTGIDVVNDFRSADVASGGQGAPLAPLYHRALLGDRAGPMAILNLGGVGNVTYIANDDTILAFDTGPANALIDDWIRQHTGANYDQDGQLALSGSVDERILSSMLTHPYFHQPPPKSLDRNSFDPTPIQNLSVADGAATLTAFTIASVVRALEHMPIAPRQWFVTGGGRHNSAIMDGLRNALQTDVKPVEDIGWNGDALEAQAFGFLAVRSLYGLPLSLPGTTGVSTPQTGGRIHRAERNSHQSFA